MNMNMDEMDDDLLCKIIVKHTNREIDYIDRETQRDDDDPRMVIVTGVEVHWADGSPDGHFSRTEIEDMILAQS